MDTIESGQTVPGPIVAALIRAKLTEPVRLYLYAVAVVIVTGLVLAGWLTDEWAAYCQAAAGVVLGIVPATEAARATSWSQRSHLASLRQLHSVQDVQRALGEAA